MDTVEDIERVKRFYDAENARVRNEVQWQYRTLSELYALRALAGILVAAAVNAIARARNAEMRVRLLRAQLDKIAASDSLDDAVTRATVAIVLWGKETKR